MQMLQTCAAQDPNPRFRKAVAVKVDQYQQRCAVLSAMNTEQHAAHATRVGGDAGASAEGFEMDGQQQREQHGQHGQHDAGQHPVHHGSGGFPPSVGPPHPSTQPSIMPAATHAAAPAPPLPSHVSTNSNGGLPLSSSLTRHGTGVSQRSMLVNSRSNSGYSQTEWRDIAIGRCGFLGWCGIGCVDGRDTHVPGSHIHTAHPTHVLCTTYIKMSYMHTIRAFASITPPPYTHLHTLTPPHSHNPPRICKGSYPGTCPGTAAPCSGLLHRGN